MEKLFKEYDKESMRMEMLKHEETFKEQVYELHRLYRIQKALMKSIENSRPNRKRQFDSGHPANEHHGNRMLEVIDESNIELTLGPPTKKQHEISTPPRTSDSGRSFSSSSTESCHTTTGFRNASESNADLGEQLRKERLIQAPWIFQVLTMKMT
ncbi:hypothetical protein F3Y22_tig00113124pilonHSYRG00214 [Hibiscus syriacus]|uniref:Uncharacterized protein n=1 Tax=Hibiscus syriacus TaxID=106335 RepID=A0A6A2WRI8_HIBSY|nr:uncharacterized protein LOC120185621 [Hibiscus syriacus]XP_039045724.1 uncharacterized protein LOC120185621 [Hibiscus syriacus]KAE8662851.1 hypothetical protein F3Y22_tig00113124pilonHSYRG00214 [Hibiscus syriacus]